MNGTVETARSWSRRQGPEFVDRLLGFLRISSLSVNPDRADDVVAAAIWLAENMRASGLEHIEVIPGAGYAIVGKDRLHADADIQPSGHCHVMLTTTTDG